MSGAQGVWRVLLLAAWMALGAAIAQTPVGMFAGFDEFCGLPVYAGSDPQVASARRDAQGDRYISIDHSVLGGWSMSTRFALAHECAHHKLGHTTAIGNEERFRGGTRKQELEADCWAAQRLRRAGYTSDITRTILQHASAGHFTTSDYPTGYERAQAILECTGQATRSCRTVTERCGHAAHPDGDQTTCAHYAVPHPSGDLLPCQHACWNYGRQVPCHPEGDVYRCGHASVPVHRYDVVTCQHIAHPGGHPREVCD